MIKKKSKILLMDLDIELSNQLCFLKQRFVFLSGPDWNTGAVLVF